jgi:peptidoglycan/xylan/chitin deacetylase (PgdA/CDA1 family)
MRESGERKCKATGCALYVGRGKNQAANSNQTTSRTSRPGGPVTFLAVLPSSHRRFASFAAAAVLAALALTSFPSAGVSGIWTTTFAPTADAYVNQAATSTNFGTAPQLYAGATPTMRSYLKFVIPQLGGTVSKGTLRVYATESSATGFAVRSSGNGWQEGTIVYSGSPNPSATITASSGPLTAGAWTTVDVTPLVKNNATITLVLTGTGSPAAALASRESANPPRLDVDINDTALPAVTVTQPAAGATLANPLPAVSGRAGNLFSDSPTVTARLYAGSSATGTPVQTRTVTRQGTDWSAPASVPLPNGQYTARAEQQDAAGNTGLSNTRTFNIADNATPVVTLSQPANGATLTNGSPTFSGTAGSANGDSSLVTVKLYAGSSATGTPLQTLSATRQGTSYSVGVSAPLANGTYTARAEQQDAAPHTGFSTANTFTIGVPDTTVPVVTLTQPADGATSTSAVPSFAGVAGAATGDAAAVTVKVYAGSSASGTPVQTLSATRQADSSYAVNASGPLANGTYTAQAEQRDASGNTGLSSANTFSIADADAPVVTLTQPADGATLTTMTPSFAGLAGAVAGDSATVTVRVYSGSSASGAPVQTLSATRQAGNGYAVNASSPLPAGTYTAQAEQQDAGANTGVSSANTFTVPDLIAPAVTLTQPANGATVSTTTPSFSGVAGSAPGDSSLVTVKVYAGSSASGTPVQTLGATREADSSYSVGVNAPLADGTYTARAEQQDAAGNTGLSSAATFTVPDQLAPTVTLNQPVDGATLSTSLPGFAGAAGAAAGDSASVTVKVYAGSSASGTPLQTLSATRQANSSYAVTASAPLANGTYTAQAEQQDASGNTGISSASTFTIADTDAPVVTLTQPADGATLVTPTPSFAGVAGAAAGDSASVTVKVYAGSSVGGTPVQTLTATRQADSSYAVNASAPLAEATYTAQAEQQDAGGNTGSSSTTTFTISDATPPIVTLTQPANGATVAGATPSFSGVAGSAAGDSSLVSVKVYAGSSATGTPMQTLSANRQADNSYSVNASAPLASGIYTAQADQQDALGNTGFSSANTFTVPDTTAPVVTLSQPANGARVVTQLPTYAGSAGAAAGDSATVTVRVYAGASASGTPVQTLSATRQADNSYSVSGTVALAFGTYTARAEQHDASGNTGLSSANTFTIADATPPAVTLTAPANGATLTTAVPSFTGVAGAAAGDLATVTVRIYAGTSASGTPVQSRSVNRQADNSYTVSASPALANGTYTARAEQQDSSGNTGFSTPTTFTIADTTAPAVTLTRPLNNGVSLLRPNFAGAGGSAPGDATTVTVKVYAGTSASGTPVRTLTATRAADNTYSVTTTAAAALTAGTYTARAEQQDAGGNVGLSSANTFSVQKTIVSIGFDDGNGGQWQARAMLASHGIHATFFLNSPLITNNPNYLTWEQVAQLYADGNEIGGHTMYHSFLLQVDQAEATRQICYDRNNILAHGFPITNFAIPFGEYNATIKTLIQSCGYNSGRSTDSFEGLCPPSCAETVPPADLWATQVVGYGPDGLQTLQDKITAAEQNGGGWVQLLFHDICANCGVNGTTAETLQAFLDWLAPRTAQSTVTATVQQVIGGAVQPAVPAPPLPPAPGATNGIRFGNMERDADANGIPDCTRPNSWGGHTGTWTRTSDAHAGSWAERVDATGYGDGADVLQTFDDMGYCTPTVIPGRTYRLTTWYKSTGPVRFTANLRKDDFSSPFPWWTESPSFPASATWRQASWITPPIPAGNNGILFGLMNTGNGTMTLDDIGIFDANPTVP